MSYALARYRSPAPRSGMGGSAEWFGGGSSDSEEQVRCINKANNSSQVRAIEGEISRLRQSWNPTGYFRPADILGVVAKIKDAAATAGAALAKAPLSTGDAEAMKREAFRDAEAKIAGEGMFYEDGARSAAQAGKGAVYAPAFKRWVLGSMQQIANVYVTATVLHCRQTWVERYLDEGYKAISKLGGYVAGILGVAGDVIKNAAGLIPKGFGLLAFILEYAPYAAAGLGAWFVYSNFIREK